MCPFVLVFVTQVIVAVILYAFILLLNSHRKRK